MESGVKVLGKIKFFNKVKGYGFAKLDDGTEVFIHHTNFDGALGMDDRIEFEVTETPKGLKATNVKKL